MEGEDREKKEREKERKTNYNDKEVEIHQSTSAPIQLKDFEFRIDQGNNVCYA